MIQALIPTASPNIESHCGAMVSAASDKGFKSVLKTTVSKTNDAGSDSSMVKTPDQTNVTKPAVASNKPTEDTKDNQDTKDTNISDNQIKTAQPKQDPKEELQQIIAQMTAVAQQILINNPVKDASTMLALIGQSGAQQAANSGQLQNIVQPQNSGTDQQGQANGNSLWTAAGQNAVAAVDKTSGNAKNTSMDMAGKSFQGEQTNSSQDATADIKTNAAADFSSMINKNSAVLSKKDAFDESVSSLTGSLSSDKQAGEVKSSKDAAGVYNSFMQVQSSSGHTTPVQETIPVNRINTIDEVISKAVSNGQKEIVLRLDPPDLGSIHIKLSMDNGILKADVRVDSSMVKDNFMNAMPQIKSALESAGIKASSFNVDVRDDQQKQAQDNNNQNKQQQQRQPREFSNAFSDFFA